MPRTKRSKDIFTSIYCDNCNKLFFIADKQQYVYKIIKKGKTTYYCSYKCWRDFGGY